MRLLFLVATVILSSVTISVQCADPVVLDVNLGSFLRRSDLVYTWNQSSPTQPDTWTTSLYGGNGNLGFMVWFPKKSQIRIDVSRVDVYDDRTPDMSQYMGNFVFDQPRLPIGHFLADLPGTFISGHGRTTLSSGTTGVHVVTSNGTCFLEIFANAAYHGADVLAFQASANLIGNLNFVPEPADTTWSDPKYVPNPSPMMTTSSPRPNQTQVLVMQPHLKGTAHATGILYVGLGGYVAISGVVASQAIAAGYVNGELYRAQAVGYTNLRNQHTNSWSIYWKSSGGLVMLDDTPFETFYYVQLYKFGSAVRPDGVVHDLEGPWFIDQTPWPDLHWDMNLQQTYVFPMTANRIPLSKTLVEYMYGLHRSGALAGNVPTEWQHDSSAAPTGASSLVGNETCYWDYGPNCKTAPSSITGNLLWAVQVVALHGAYSGNTSVITKVVFPILVRALNFYTHFQITNTTDGSIHLPPTFSPEYPGPRGPDCNYDLSLYRWGLQNVLDIAKKYSLSDPALATFQSAKPDALLD